ncbi:MAG: hypothetical protein KIG38_07400 [Bacteroidales bacterium]|nr:hypothetical protein [Bacteroidales bacterium]MDD6052986.1 hypothetical protein [Bacteroidales bacterium]
MNNRLQELTDKLYNEGLSKGKAEGEALLAQAKEKAAAIVEEARKEAEAIVGKARKDAEELSAKVSNDIRMASSQSMQATRMDIENLVVSKMVDTDVKKAMSSADFLKEVITAVARNFSAQESSDISLVLPEALKGELEPFVKNELGKILGKGVEASFSKKIAGGFRIAPKDGGYFISMTDETMKELIGEYLRPATRKILFG